MTAPETDGRRQRSDRRRRELLEAGLQIVSTVGMAGLTHREVAARAHASLGLIRYHFDSRDNLALAVLQEIEDRRHRMAVSVIVRAQPLESDRDAAIHLLDAYYGPDTSREGMIATLGWLVDAAREPLLAEFLRRQRPNIENDLTSLLRKMNRPTEHLVMLRQVVDGAVVAGAAEGAPDLENHVVDAIANAMRRLGAPMGDRGHPE